MITRTPASVPTDPAALDARGGFAWWYLDLVDDQGRGLVLIWSFGLPFLPGYASSARRGDAPAARSRPSLTLSLYDGGRIAFYDLGEHTPDDASWDPHTHRWTFGASTIRWEHSEDGSMRTLYIDLDRPIPGTRERLTGQIRVHGRLCQGDAPVPHETDAPSHVWSPMMLGCRGTADLQAGDFQFAIDGRAYHDRNAGLVPLHALGIGRWWWGRISFSDHDFIWYRLQPDDGGPVREMALRVTTDGHITELDTDVALGTDVRGSFGLASPESVLFHDADGVPVVVALESLVDDGPFYQRHIVRGVWRGEVGRGFAELVVPDQIDRDLHRPFVRMRVHQDKGRNSMFLPLFTGPRTGRLLRLPRWWTGAA